MIVNPDVVEVYTG